MDDAFGYWFAGLCDGEACFTISEARKAGAVVGYRCGFEIRLRDDDAAMLRTIERELQIGKLSRIGARGATNPSMRLAVHRKADARALVDLLDRFPLRSKKAADYAIWREAVLEWERREFTTHAAGDWGRIAELRDLLMASRKYGAPPVPLLEFVVTAHPEPAGSKRAFIHPHTKRVVVTDANKKAKGWKEAVAAEAREMWAEPPLEGALELELTFFLKRPESHWRTGRNRHLLRDAAPALPIGRPDLLKLTRGVEDALTGIVWRDDAGIVRESLEKRYGEPERVELRVYEAAEQSALDLPAEERERYVQAEPLTVDDSQLALA